MFQGAAKLPVPSWSSGQCGVLRWRWRHATSPNARRGNGRGHVAVLRVPKRRRCSSSRSGPVVLSVAVRRRSRGSCIVWPVHISSRRGRQLRHTVFLRSSAQQYCRSADSGQLGQRFHRPVSVHRSCRPTSGVAARSTVTVALSIQSSPCPPS